MWEYKREETDYGSYAPAQFMRLLNNYGKEGWEVIHYSEDDEHKAYKFTVLMKRRVL